MTSVDNGSLQGLCSVVLAALLAVQCAGRSSAPKLLPESDGSDGTANVWALPAGALDTQRLYRVRYEGQEGQGGMKLILKLSSASRFQVLTSDALGRPLWSLEAKEEETLLVDHRAKEFCRAKDIHLPDPVLEAMPWRSLPRVLLGYLPTDPETIHRSSAEEIDFRGSDGRRWTSRLEAGRPKSWVLWEDSRPALWWSRRGEGGMVSHRQGIQIRWREIVAEPLQSPVLDLQIPSGYGPSECHARDLP